MIEPTTREQRPGAHDLELLSGWLSQTAESERIAARFAALADTMSAGIIVMTRERVVCANHAATHVLGFPAEELPATRLGRLFPEHALRTTVRQALGRAWNGAIEDLGVIPIARGDGTRRYTAVTLRPLSLELEPTLLVVLTEGLATGRPESGRPDSNDALRVFGLYLAALANDLRAPLTAHLAHLRELTERADLPADLRRAFGLYRRVTSETLERFARAMEWGRRGALTERVDLLAVVESAVVSLERETLFAGGIRLERDLAAVPPVLGIASQLQLALEHVLRNACEALTPRGGTIRVTLKAETPGPTVGSAAAPDGRSTRPAGRVAPTSVRLAVADDGPGVPDSLLPHVFEPFSSTKSIATGLGLGLAIVKDIVSRHRGDVTLETSPAGTTAAFVFTPLDDASPVDLESVPPPARPRRVLIVDDDLEVRETFRLLIERAGYEVVGAGDAEEALTLVSQDEMDALVVDVQLSGRDGLAFLEALALWHPSLLPRVALQTAYAYEERVRVMAERYGVMLLAKPSPTDVLLQALQQLTTR